MFKRVAILILASLLSIAFPVVQKNVGAALNIDTVPNVETHTGRESGVGAKTHCSVECLL